MRKRFRCNGAPGAGPPPIHHNRNSKPIKLNKSFILEGGGGERGGKMEEGQGSLFKIVEITIQGEREGDSERGGR